ncbi:MAG TPA: microviridin/marinostatin family tricyclic proteinase inhibitor [Pyrinomonadaceae bacterium]|jgi:hypothetical protein
MKGSNQKEQAVPPPDAATPFFARFLEDQHGGDAATKPAAQLMTLKYPSDRDEDNVYSPAAEAAATKATAAGPSRMTLKYPSDRDEDDVYSC